jgi:hypothetical protein
LYLIELPFHIDVLELPEEQRLMAEMDMRHDGRHSLSGETPAHNHPRQISLTGAQQPRRQIPDSASFDRPVDRFVCHTLTAWIYLRRQTAAGFLDKTLLTPVLFRGSNKRAVRSDRPQTMPRCVLI